MLNTRTNWLIEYETILKAIPKAWKEKLYNSNMNTKVKKDFKSRKKNPKKLTQLS